MTKEAQNRRICRAMDKWIISWIGLKSGSLRLRKNHKTPGRKTSRSKMTKEAK